MEKTWQVREQEIRQEIALKITNAIEEMMPPVDDVELAIYNALNWATEIALGE